MPKLIDRKDDQLITFVRNGLCKVHYNGGIHATEESAAKAYDILAKKHFKEFAYLNFPEVQECQN